MSAATVALACARKIEREEKPTAPNVDAVLSAYESPTAPLNQDTAEGLLAYVADTYGVLEGLDLQEHILDPIFEALEKEPPERGAGGAAELDPIESRFRRANGARLGRVRSSHQSVTLEGDGFLRVTRVCEGWEEPVVDEEKNGSILAIVGFSDQGLDPVLFGDVFDCRYQAAGGDVFLDNEPGELGVGMALHIGEDVDAEGFGEQPILFVLDVRAEIDAQVVDLPASFRFDPSRDLYEFLFETVEGSLVLLVREGAVLGIRAADGEYSCDARALTCTSGDGAVVSL